MRICYGHAQSNEGIKVGNVWKCSICYTRYLFRCIHQSKQMICFSRYLSLKSSWLNLKNSWSNLLSLCVLGWIALLGWTISFSMIKFYKCLNSYTQSINVWIIDWCTRSRNSTRSIKPIQKLLKGIAMSSPTSATIPMNSMNIQWSNNYQVKYNYCRSSL